MLFAFSKLAWTFVAPDNFLLLLLAVGVALLWTRRAGAGRVLASVATAAFVLIAVLPIHAWLLTPLERRFPPLAVLPDRVDGIIVLAGETEPDLSALYRQTQLNDAAERATSFVALGLRYRQAKLVYSGGSSRIGVDAVSAADEIRPLLVSLGLDPRRVVFEGRSRNTYESAVALYRLLHPAPGQRWLLITSAYHMPRAVGAFRRAGWSITPYPVDYNIDPTLPLYARVSLELHFRHLKTAMHEWLGLTAYRLLDRTDTLFPGP